MATFAKPENALKRADELIHVGQKQAALQALHDLITSKRYRSWQKPLEKIMMKYVELCVDLRKGRFAKDGLIQYRIVCQQVNVSSLEDVIKHFMQLSNEKAEQARNQAQALEDALDVEDLEADKRPEDLMLSYVSGEKGKDRSDREVVTPWFKFLWETYRTVLEILRNNSKLEALYAMTAHKAFQFCKQYKRTTEFRRLCEIIRNHLANLNKYRDQRDRPDLNAPESSQLYLDTRVEQLKIATDLSLWQEAFRSVEDIHGLMSMVKKTPKPSVLVVYYAKLTEIFWISDSHLYHAYAWLKLFNLQKSYNKNLSQKDLQLIASSVLLAALSVAPYGHKYGASHLELENEKDRNLRMANLINFSLDSKRENREVPSRASLLAELAAKGVISCASQEVKDLYNLLEHEFLPLTLTSKVQPLLSKISKIGGKLSSASSVPEVQLSQYLPALEKLTTLRVLQQASRIFQSMKIDMLSRMIPFFDFAVMEKISVDAVKHNFVSMKVNHLLGAVHFGNMDIESEGFSNHLSVLADSLNKALKALKRAKEQAACEGRKLEEVVEERWGSLGHLAASVSASRAAPSHAHFHAIRGRRAGQVDYSEEHAKGNPKEGRQGGDSGVREYLRDVSSRDHAMRKPKPDSVPWKRNRQNISSEDQALISSAIAGMNKFSNDGSFMEKINNFQSKNANVSTVEADEQRDTEQKSHKESSKKSPLVSTQKLNANQLAAKILQLRMKGKHEEAEQLSREMEAVLENQDAAVEESRYEKERISIRHTIKPSAADRKKREEDADLHLANKIMHNKQYNMSKSVEDEYDFGDAPSKKGKRKNKDTHEDKRNTHRHFLTQKERCLYCFENPSRPKHLVVAIGNFTYLMLPQFEPVVPGHCVILPLQHESATRTVDRNVWEEIRNFKKCLLKMFAQQDKDVVFMETVISLTKQRRHCMIECIPVPCEVSNNAPMYFKKAIDEAEEEWTQHEMKKLIPTKGNLWQVIPENFAYFHVEFGLDRGFVHVIDDESKFSAGFGLNVIRGMLRLPEEDMHRRQRHESMDKQKQAVASFMKDWEPFDWTKQLD